MLSDCVLHVRRVVVALLELALLLKDFLVVSPTVLANVRDEPAYLLQIRSSIKCNTAATDARKWGQCITGYEDP